MKSEWSGEELARKAAGFIDLEPPPSEEDIAQIVSRLAQAFGSNRETADAAIRILHAQFDIRMELGQTIRAEDHTPWLDRRRATIEQFYWNRYRALLLRDGWSPMVVQTLHKSMDELLDLLGDPANPSKWKRRGLVVGDVQSGKTASYAALLCKAADAGYKMVILLTGTLENVRRQTQARLDAAFVGLDSREFLDRNRSVRIGVGDLDRRRFGVVLTSRVADFRKAQASSLTFSLGAVNEPVLVVTKKNKSTLARLASWLRTKNANRDGHIDLPLLLIDDEADNASINTRGDGETTAINAAIRDLLVLFSRSSYVGFTATPFANIFIDPSSENEMLRDDLFPRDFIHLLDSPTNYVGMNQFFPQRDPDTDAGNNGDERLSGVRTIDDSSTWLAPDHRQDALVQGPLPESLNRALHHFLISCAVRDVRAQQSGKDKNIHRSMLVNVSRFTAVQNRVAAALSLHLDQIRDAIRLYGRLDPEHAAEKSRFIKEMAAHYRNEFLGCEVSWAEVLSVLHESVSPIRVQGVNQSTGTASLDYSLTEEAPGVRVIAVGGNSLSRGLTLEGLCVSYFLRNSKAYDTLLQMGRWFGYRDGYRELCRLFVSEEAEGWYRHITEATNELKRDFGRMRRRRATPIEFGLRVRTHPDTLLITARNKMSSGKDVVGEVRDISLAGRGIETTRLYADAIRNYENFQVVDRLLCDLGQPEETRVAGAHIWRDAPAERIALFLDEFLIHPRNHDFQGDALAEYLRDSPPGSRMSRWNVVLPCVGAGRQVSDLKAGLAVSSKQRRVLVRDMQSLLVSGKNARVGSRGDLRHGLRDDQLEDLKANAQTEGREIAEDEYRARFSQPLLILYLIEGIERKPEEPKESARVYLSGTILPAFALHFPSEMDLPKAASSEKRYIRYRLNKVAQVVGIDTDDDPEFDESYQDED